MAESLPSGFVSRLLDFNRMIGPTLIKFIYYAGLVGIALYAVVILIGALAAMSYSPVYAVGGLIGAGALLIVGTVFWRFTCELWILLFNIHDRLVEIRDQRRPAI